MGLETLVVGGESVTYFNIAEEMVLFRDMIFSFLSNYAAGFFSVLITIWVVIFVIALIYAFRQQMQRVS